MKIATWNIGGGLVSQDNNLTYNLENIEYFVNELRKINPDVVCLQEIHVSDTASQPNSIAKALNFAYKITESIAPSHLKDGEMLSISIISRFPITSSKFNLLPNPNLEFIWNGEKARSHDKGFIEANIAYRGKEIRVLSGHMVPFRKFGRNFMDDEFKEIRDKIEEIITRVKTPEIVCADMNWQDIYALIPNVFAQEFKFVLQDAPTTPKDRKYDKIIISKDWICKHSEIIRGRADHFLCFADIELQNSAIGVFLSTK